MKITNLKILLTCCLLISGTNTVMADIFYTTKEYSGIYNEKVALEIELKNLNRQHQNEKSNFTRRIKELEIELEGLKKDNSLLKNINSSDRDSYLSRINELQKLVELLKSKGTETEKNLIETNRLLQQKCDEESTRMKNQIEDERSKLLAEIQALKKSYEDRINELKTEIANLNTEITES